MSEQDTRCALCGVAENSDQRIYLRPIGKTDRWQCSDDGCDACGLRASLRDCRARLAALVEAYGFACGVCDDPACIAFRDAQRWLAAHPEAGNG